MSEIFRFVRHTEGSLFVAGLCYKTLTLCIEEEDLEEERGMFLEFATDKIRTWAKVVVIKEYGIEFSPIEKVK